MLCEVYETVLSGSDEAVGGVGAALPPSADRRQAAGEHRGGRGRDAERVRTLGHPHQQ